MILSPEEFIPAEVAMRTTLAKQAWRSQSRRTSRPRHLGWRLSARSRRSAAA